jgi:hypothetical protein
VYTPFPYSLGIGAVRLSRLLWDSGSLVRTLPLFWSFSELDVNEFVPVSPIALRAFDIVPGVTRDASNSGSGSYDPPDLHEGFVAFGAHKS